MNRFQKIFDAQKALFATGVTRTYEWRVEQLDRMARMIRENERRFQEAMAKDFKTASQEYIFETQASAGETEVQKSQLKEWMRPVEAPVPSFLAKTGHKGMIYREPYGVALIIGPFNGPLLLLIRPALAALAAGNTCILTLSEALPATTEVLLELVQRYFDPSAVTAVPGGTGFPKRSATKAVMTLFNPKWTAPEMFSSCRAMLKFGCDGGPPRMFTCVDRTTSGGETAVTCAVTWMLPARSPLRRMA